jgi:Rrf2 family transcriptional regulator, iron-sulfur cluster assembly transcription factor
MLNQAVGYAASALGCIAAMGGKPALVRTIARSCQVPPAYLAKIINRMARKRFVRTQRGLGGGVTLARPEHEITLFDLCVALDDPIIEPRCVLGLGRCSDDRACPAHEFCKTSRQEQIAFLRRTTIADIAAFELRRRRRARTAGARPRTAALSSRRAG